MCSAATLDIANDGGEIQRSRAVNRAAAVEKFELDAFQNEQYPLGTYFSPHNQHNFLSGDFRSTRI